MHTHSRDYVNSEHPHALTCRCKSRLLFHPITHPPKPSLCRSQSEMADGNTNLYRGDEWLTTWDSLPPESAELARRRDRHIRRRHRNNPPMYTEYTINYRHVITEADVASCTQADEDVLS